MDLDVPECVRIRLEERGGIPGMKDLIPPDEHVDHVTQIFQALSSPVRIKVLTLLDSQPLCPCIIAQVVGVASSKLSYHLAALQRAGLIEGEQRGRWIMYTLTPLGKKMLRTASRLSRLSRD